MNAFHHIRKNMLIAATVIALMTSITGDARAQDKGDLHYLAIGVSTVPGMPQHMQLRFAHKDALDLARAWQSQQGPLYGNVRGETLTNEKAKLADIVAGLDRLEANAKAGDTVVVSFAGHGGVLGMRSSQWMFVPYDYNPYNATQTGLYEWQVREQLTRLTKRGATVILIVDTCHAAAFASADSGIVIFAACSVFEESLEDSNFQNGLFSRAMIEAMQGRGDSNQDGIITLAEIDSYVTTRLREMHASNPSFDENGRRRLQQPVHIRPTSVERDRPLAGASNPSQQPTAGPDRMRAKAGGN